MGAVNKDIVAGEQTRLLEEKKVEAGSKWGCSEQAVNESNNFHLVQILIMVGKRASKRRESRDNQRGIEGV